jgi:hypothetical protein
MLFALAASGDQNGLAILLLLALVVLVLGGSRKRSRYIPTPVKRQALAKFFLEHYSDAERAKKPLRLKDYEFDHIVPFSKGGSNEIGNIKVIPKKENRRKGNRIQ